MSVANASATGAVPVAPAYLIRLRRIVEEHFMIEQDIRRNAQETALSMIKLHGLRAQAVAQERAAELRQQGDTAGYDLWQQVMRQSANCGGLRRRWREHKHRPVPAFGDTVAGAGGFEPPDGGIKIRCLTPWLRPIRRCVNRSRARQVKPRSAAPQRARPSATSPLRAAPQRAWHAVSASAIEAEAGGARAAHARQQAAGRCLQCRQHVADHRLQARLRPAPGRFAARARSAAMAATLRPARLATPPVATTRLPRAEHLGGRDGDPGIDQQRCRTAAAPAPAPDARRSRPSVRAGRRGIPARRRRVSAASFANSAAAPDSRHSRHSSRNAAAASAEPPPMPDATGSACPAPDAHPRPRRPPPPAPAPRAAPDCRVRRQARRRTALPPAATAYPPAPQSGYRRSGEHDQAVQQVVAVIPAAGHVQVEIDLGRRRLGQAVRHKTYWPLTTVDGRPPCSFASSLAASSGSGLKISARRHW